MSVGQITRQGINYFYVNEEISVTEHEPRNFFLICWSPLPRHYKK